MKKRFNGIYRKRAGAGFCGREAIVRTPSRGEVLASVCYSLARMLGGAGGGLTEGGKKYFKDIVERTEGKTFNLNEIIDSLIEKLYFEPCFLCDDSECREWNEVYGLTDNSVFCHVSDCQLEELPERMDEEGANDIPLYNGVDMPLDEYLNRLIGKVMLNDNVNRILIEISKNNLDTGEFDIYQAGYARGLQDILDIVKARKGKSTKDV